MVKNKSLEDYIGKDGKPKKGPIKKNNWESKWKKENRSIVCDCGFCLDCYEKRIGHR